MDNRQHLNLTGGNLVRTVREIIDELSAPSPCPLPRGAREHWTVISRTVLTDEGMKAFLQMPNLESFWLLHHCPPEHPCLISDEGMKALARCTALRELRIVGTKLTDIGVQHLSRLPDLRRIYIEATYITPNSLCYLVSTPHLEEISIRGNRGAFGEFSYADIADYDRLGTAMTRGAAKAMASAEGVSRRVLIGSTLAVDPSVVEALCRTPTVEQISIHTYASWMPPPTIFAALHEQHHLKWLTYHLGGRHLDLPGIIRVIRNVDNETVCVSFPGRSGSIREWLNYAEEQLESRSDGMRRASGVERQDGGPVLESVISRRLQVVAGAGLCASLIACRRFATLGRSGWLVYHGFAPMAIAWRRFATGTKSLRVATRPVEFC